MRSLRYTNFNPGSLHNTPLALSQFCILNQRINFYSQIASFSFPAVDTSKYTHVQTKLRTTIIHYSSLHSVTYLNTYSRSLHTGPVIRSHYVTTLSPKWYLQSTSLPVDIVLPIVRYVSTTSLSNGGPNDFIFHIQT